MIVPKKEDISRSQKTFPVVAALCFVGLCFSALAATPLPELRSGRETLRELDPLLIARYVPVPPKRTTANDNVVRPEADDVPSVELAQAEIDEAMTKLAERFGSANPGVIPDVTSSSKDPAQAPRLQASDVGDRLRALFGPESKNQITTVGPGRSARKQADRTSLVDRRSAEMQEEPLPESDWDALGQVFSGTEQTQAVHPDEDERSINVKLHEEDSYEQIDVDSFGSWIEENQSELPTGIKAHLGYDPAFASASLKLNTDGSSVELYMMYKPALRELHIVLVDGNDSIYLIDRGFTESSHALREGIVTRAGGEIIAVDSQPRAAGSARATAFYSVFLSWWEGTRETSR